MTPTLPAQAANLLNRIQQETNGMREGRYPSPNVTLDLHRELVGMYSALSEEMCQKFSAKERAYLSRKIAEANQYRAGRHDDKLTVKDAEVAARLNVGEEVEKEIDSSSEYEQYRALLRSLDHALDYIRSLTSYLKKENA